MEKLLVDSFATNGKTIEVVVTNIDDSWQLHAQTKGDDIALNGIVFKCLKCESESMLNFSRSKKCSDLILTLMKYATRQYQ